MFRIVCLFAASTACSSVSAPDDNRPPAGFISGAGRLTSSKYTFDVELGHAISQKPVTSAAPKVTGSSALKSSPRSMIQ